MEKLISVDDAKKNGQLCPGGDLRVKGNRFLMDALKASGIPRILRGGKIQIIVALLDHKHKLCQSLSR